VLKGYKKFLTQSFAVLGFSNLHPKPQQDQTLLARHYT